MGGLMTKQRTKTKGQSHILTYFQIQWGFSIQPDIQYIIRPGGFDQANNALVLGLQIAVEL
jgi:carbohydrate-selective porin OprB